MAGEGVPRDLVAPSFDPSAVRLQAGLHLPPPTEGRRIATVPDTGEKRGTVADAPRAVKADQKVLRVGCRA